MHYEKLKELFTVKPHPPLKLLRANNAPLIISFLYKEFKENHRISIPGYELAIKLAGYLEYISYNEEDKEEKVSQQDDVAIKAKKYIAAWVHPNQAYLASYPNDEGETMHDLTPHTEIVLEWVQSKLVEKRAFVGTESKFRDILDKLRELIEKSTESREQRLADLERKKQAIEEEIRQVSVADMIITYDATQIRERFDTINRLTRELASDFSEVEQNFKDIVRSIYDQQLDKKSSKGKILGFTLDALDELKEKDQGKSFYAFWRFLADDESQENLRKMVEQVFQLLDSRNIEYNRDRSLRRLHRRLHERGKKVKEVNDLLAEKLSRIIAERDVLEHKKALELTGDILNAYKKLVADPPTNDKYFFIAGAPDVNLPIRPLGEEKEEAIFNHHPSETAGNNLLQGNFDVLFNQFSINKQELKNNIATLLTDRTQITLAEVIEVYRVTHGLAEILTYFSIASESPKHLINTDETEYLRVDQDNRLKAPQVIYTR